MRIALFAVACLITTPSFAQPFDPNDPQTQALQAQLAVQADDARRAAAEAEREADVARQRLETEQRIQSLETQRASQQLRESALDVQSQPPPASSGRTLPPPRALQPRKPAAKP